MDRGRIKREVEGRKEKNAEEKEQINVLMKRMTYGKEDERKRKKGKLKDIGR